MEEIIYRYLLGQFGGNNILCTYMDLPAVFNTKAPDDKDDGWGDNPQYPRVIFELNMQADSERKVSGQLYIDVMCENKLTEPLDDMEALIKGAVDGCFFSTPEMTISAQWISKNAFEQPDDKVCGTTMVFDVLAYPNQLTESPDPIEAVNTWIKNAYPEANVIGKDTLAETWKPTDESPAVYCRLYHIGESPRLKSTYNVDWFGAEIHVNVMAPSENVRATLCKQLTQKLTHSVRIMLDDGSPMLIDKIASNTAADPLKEGQIQINGTYGVLPERKGTPLKRAYVKGMQAKKEAEHSV